MPTREKGMAAMINRGVRKLYSAEGDAEIAENFLRDEPFAVPFDGVRAGDFVDLVREGEDDIYGTFDDAGDIRGDVGDGHQVFAIEGFIGDTVLDDDDFAERNAIDAKGEECFGAGAGGAVEADLNGDVFAGIRIVQQAGCVAGGRDCKRPGQHLRGDAIGGCLGFIDAIAAAGLIVFAVPIDIDDAVGVFEDAHDFAGNTIAAGGVGPIDFGDQCLQDWRAGRHFGHLDARIELPGNGQEAPAHLARDAVAVTLAVVFV